MYMPGKNSPNLKLVNDRYLQDVELEELEDEGEGGSEGGKGTSAPLVDPSIFGLTNHIFLELLRQEERKFSNGWVPYTKDPQQPNSSGTPGQGPPPHPLLSQSAQFSGDDKKVTANPVESEKGLENYKELQHVLTPSPSPKPTPTAAPTFKPL